VAVPVAPRETCRMLSEHADEVLCLSTPARFRAVGDWYDDFSQVDDDEVRRLLGMGAEPPA
jgi:putative phosphoribosyl transferase